MGVEPNDAILAQVHNELEEELYDEHHHSKENNEETTQGKIIRDTIAAKMWVDYIE